MTNRTIYVIGQGYSPTPVSIVATLDGNVVQNGTIPTVDQDISVSQLPGNTELQQQMLATKTALFSFEKDIAYNGTTPVTIEVTGGPVWFGAVLSNYVLDYHPNPALSAEQLAIVQNPASTMAELQQIQFDIANPPFTAEEIAQIQTYTSFPYPPEVSAMVNEHNATLRYSSSGATGFKKLPDLDGNLDDTWSNVSINGVPQPINPDAYDPPRTGTWWWTLQPGDVFSGTLRVVAGTPAP
jgi:hypothetical protein